MRKDVRMLNLLEAAVAAPGTLSTSCLALLSAHKVQHIRHHRRRAIVPLIGSDLFKVLIIFGFLVPQPSFQGAKSLFVMPFLLPSSSTATSPTPKLEVPVVLVATGWRASGTYLPKRM